MQQSLRWKVVPQILEGSGKQRTDADCALGVLDQGIKQCPKSLWPVLFWTELVKCEVAAGWHNDES
jgi:hypothetical protein